MESGGAGRVIGEEKEKQGECESNLRQSALDINIESFEAYITEWFQWTWPTFLHKVSKRLESLAQQRWHGKSNVAYICKYCFDDWGKIGCEQHVLFTCPKVASVKMDSFLDRTPRRTSASTPRSGSRSAIILQ